MGYASQRDRQTQELEFTKLPWPAPPLNLFVTSGFAPGLMDLQWDDPTELALNSRWRILGVNIYRSFDSEYGPYQRVTDLLVGSRYWRDQTLNEVVIEEDVTNQFVLFGECSAVGDRGPRYVFKTQNYPIVKAGSQMVNADTGDVRTHYTDGDQQVQTSDVQVFIDGKPAAVLNVWGSTGEIEIDPTVYIDVAKQAWDPTVVPTGGDQTGLGPGNASGGVAPGTPGAQPTSRITCTYRFTRQPYVRTDLFQRIHYRATTVGIPIDKDLSVVQPQDLIETPLEHATATNTYELEKLDWIWREAVRRNRWILEQGGERVKAFLRKNAGIICPNQPDDYHKQPINDCPICFGTGIIGGYDGPYDIIIAPPDAERKVRQSDKGRLGEFQYESWTGATPLLSMRDFLVKLNGDRFSLGGIRMPTNRGNLIQQHFNLWHIDEKDIRCKVPVSNPVMFLATQFRPHGPELEADSKITNEPDVPVEQQLRGRTPAWQNTTY